MIDVAESPIQYPKIITTHFANDKKHDFVFKETKNLIAKTMKVFVDARY